MPISSFHCRVVSGEAGAWAAPMRWLLAGLELPYAAAIRARNRRFDSGDGIERVEVPVISVGNITVGGTGKTPFVIELCNRLGAIGRTPAVVARGYGGDGAPNDELRLIEQRCPGVSCIRNPDRVAGARLSIEEHGADVIVLDDGFQHRRLARSLNIVLLDATCPFGYDRLLPRGLLREPVESLTRADVIVVTRVDQASRNAVDAIVHRVEQVASSAAVIRARHDVVGVFDLDGSQQARIAPGQPVTLMAGIGNPASFVITAKSLGFEIRRVRFFGDHHAYTAADVGRVMRELGPSESVLTTEKDAIKLAALSGIDRGRIKVVRISMKLEGDGDSVLDRKLQGNVE